MKLYATAYRTLNQKEESILEIWKESLAVDSPLPTLPLWLNAGISVPVDLQAAYSETCQKQRLEDALNPKMEKTHE